MTREQNNCAFQYAKTTKHFSSNVEIVCDKTSITLSEAKELWNKYFLDCARHISKGDAYTAEMVIWVDMKGPNSYGNHLCYLSYDAESDGVRIWETKRVFFPDSFSTVQSINQ